MKANTILEALMKFFNEGNCRIVIEKGGLTIEVKKISASNIYYPIIIYNPLNYYY